MQFNTGQVLELAGLRREQLRHWRKVLPPLRGRDGRGDFYTLDEILALGTIAVLVDDLGISVSKLVPVAPDIFALFSEREERPSHIYLTQTGHLLVDETPDCAAYATVRFNDVHTRIRERLSNHQQQQLYLPLEG